MCINTAILGTDFDYKIHVLSTLKHSCKGLAGLFMDLQKKKKNLKGTFAPLCISFLHQLNFFLMLKTLAPQGQGSRTFEVLCAIYFPREKIPV